MELGVIEVRPTESFFYYRYCDDTQTFRVEVICPLDCCSEPHLHGDPFDATDSGRCLYGPKNYTSTSSHPPQVG